MDRLILCVPNFSEGRNAKTIEEISSAIKATDGCTLLEVEPGVSTNRTVVSFVADPEAVIKGAVAAAVAASASIDMTTHKGSHPRLGAMDVCPLVGVRGVTEEELVVLARRLGQILAATLDVPIFLYGTAATREYRTTVPQIRAGEYESLAVKMEDPRWEPDFGPAKFRPKWGATMVGVRKFLLAYNVNLISTKEQAHRIALDVRSLGRGPQQPGKLQHVQGLGWWLQEENLAQVSLNVLDHEVSPLHKVYEAVVQEAEALRLPVVGSELVGLVPLRAILQVADYYIQKEGLFVLEEDQKVRLAISKLGLSQLKPFSPQERILEYRLRKQTAEGLSCLTVEKFIQSVADRTPAPGGGSVSALLAALGAALSCMVGQLTYGKRQFESVDAEMRKIIPIVYEASKNFTTFIDKDSQAFDSYMRALKLPKSTPEQVKERTVALQEGIKEAIEVPRNLANSSNALWGTLKDLAPLANVTALSDLQVAAQCLRTAVVGACYNVSINLKAVSDETFRSQMKLEVNSAIQMANQGCDDVLTVLERRLNDVME